MTLILSPFILDETADVLRTKMGWDEGIVRASLERINGFSTLVHPQKSLSVVEEDEQDNRVIECAVSGRSDFLVSGDKHILSLGEYQGIRFLTRRDLLDALRRKQP